MSRKGFIKLDRKLLDWRWYHDANTMRVFIHLLLTATSLDEEFERLKIKRGQAVISYGGLAEELKLTVQNVRTAINHLKSTGEVTIKRYPKFLVITILNYDSYQRNNKQTNNQLTINQQSTNNIKEIKRNYKKLKEYNSATSPNSDDWSPPPKGTPEYDAWRKQ